MSRLYFLLAGGLLLSVYGLSLKFAVGSFELALQEHPQPAPFRDGSWTLVLLPDTQYLTGKRDWLFDAQTRWIRDNKERLDIRFVVHLGDITDKNATWEWQPARHSISLLGQTVPYTVLPGNHDYGDGESQTRETQLSRYFPPAVPEDADLGWRVRRGAGPNRQQLPPPQCRGAGLADPLARIRTKRLRRRLGQPGSPQSTPARRHRRHALLPAP